MRSRLGIMFCCVLSVVGVTTALAQDANTPVPAVGQADGCLIFTMDSQTDVDEFEFISSRNYGNAAIVLEYSVNTPVPTWLALVSTDAGTLGITTGGGNEYSIPFDSVFAYALRMCVIGNQVSVHEVTLSDDSEPISASSYTVSLEGFWVFGWTDWNAVSCFGQIDNEGDKAQVEALLSDGYQDVFFSGCGIDPPAVVGIYNWQDDPIPVELESFEIDK